MPGNRLAEQKTKIQTSETFLVSAVLAVSGGFQDAYTYNVRDKVFSNAQTGNVVLMSQHFMMGQWKTALSYLFPLLAFALGVLVAEQIQSKYKNSKGFIGGKLFLYLRLLSYFLWDLCHRSGI